MKPQDQLKPYITAIQLGNPPAFDYTLNILYDDGTAEVVKIPKKLHNKLSLCGLDSEG